MKTFKEWLIEEGKSDNTIKSYEHAVSTFEKWFREVNHEEITYQDIRPIDLRDWKQYLLRSAKKRNGEPLAMRTINSYIESVRTFLRFLYETKVIQYNPSTALKAQNVRTEYVPRWLDKREKKLVLREIEDPVLQNRNPWLYTRNRAIVYLSLHGGLRISEKVNLTIHDFKHGYIQIREGKGQTAREVPMNKSLSKVINEWLIERAKKEPTTDAFLISQKGGPLTVHGIYKLFDRIAENTKMPDLTPHTLRHTFGHDLIQAGNPITYVAALLGHSDLDTTRIYTSPRKKNLEDAVQSISEE